MQEIFDLLTQGSVWKRNTGRKAGQQVKVLVLTNTTLPQRVQRDHPIQVVYADAENNIYSRTVEDFASNHTFYNVDAELETRLEALLVFKEEDYEDEEDEEDEDADTDEDDVTGEPEVPVADKPVSKGKKAFADMLLADDQDEPEVDGPTEAEEPTVIQFLFSTNLERESPLNDVDLSVSLVAYSQEPEIENSRIKHSLLFALNNRVTIDSLRQSFSPSADNNTVDLFSVVGPHFNEVVRWTDYLGVYPEMAQGRAYATVLLGEEVQATVQDSGDQSSQSEDMQVEQVQDQQEIWNLTVDQQVTDVESTEVPTEQPQEQAPEQEQGPEQKVPSVQQAVQSLIQNVVPNPPPHNPQ